MKNRFIGSLAILALALAGVFRVSVQAQTTDEGSGPSEQPGAPMEIGQPQAPPPPGQRRSLDNRLSPDKGRRWNPKVSRMCRKLNPADRRVKVRLKSIRAWGASA